MSNRREEKEEETLEYQPQGTIIKILPKNAEENLFTKIGEHVTLKPPEINEIIEKYSETGIREIPHEESVIVQYIMNHITGTALGQIVDPIHGEEIILDRIAQATQILSLVVENEVLKLLYRDLKDPTINLEERVREIEKLQRICMLAIREITNRLITLYKINFPATLRPQLANVKMGYEVM